MTIASEIQRIKTNIANAYTACDNKGATIPATQNSVNLTTTINSIPSGITPTGTLSITANGVYDVTNYVSANVSVSGGSSGTYLATCAGIASGSFDSQNVQYTLYDAGDIIGSGECRVYSWYSYSINKSIVCLSVPVEKDILSSLSLLRLECSVSDFGGGSSTLSARWDIIDDELILLDCTIS